MAPIAATNALDIVGFLQGDNELLKILDGDSLTCRNSSDLNGAIVITTCQFDHHSGSVPTSG